MQAAACKQQVVGGLHALHGNGARTAARLPRFFGAVPRSQRRRGRRERPRHLRAEEAADVLGLPATTRVKNRRGKGRHLQNQLYKSENDAAFIPVPLRLAFRSDSFRSVMGHL